MSKASRRVGALVLGGALASAGAHCGGSGPTYCAKACAVDADCCPEGAPGCPGAYPQNYRCDGGLCRAPRCEQDSDCDFAFGLVCRAANGLTGCLRGCSTDDDCAAAGGLAGGTCTGKADDGTPICAATLPLCTSDAECLAPLTCSDGRCGCSSDADCPATRSRCADRQCGCASDAQCGPSLDVCTTDRAFAYPPGVGPGNP